MILPTKSHVIEINPLVAPPVERQFFKNTYDLLLSVADFLKPNNAVDWKNILLVKDFCTFLWAFRHSENGALAFHRHTNLPRHSVNPETKKLLLRVWYLFHIKGVSTLDFPYHVSLASALDHRWRMRININYRDDFLYKHIVPLGRLFSQGKKIILPKDALQKMTACIDKYKEIRGSITLSDVTKKIIFPPHIQHLLLPTLLSTVVCGCIGAIIYINMLRSRGGCFTELPESYRNHSELLAGFCEGNATWNKTIMLPVYHCDAVIRKEFSSEYFKNISNLLATACSTIRNCFRVDSQPWTPYSQDIFMQCSRQHELLRLSAIGVAIFVYLFNPAMQVITNKDQESSVRLCFMALFLQVLFLPYTILSLLYNVGLYAYLRLCHFLYPDLAEKNALPVNNENLYALFTAKIDLADEDENAKNNPTAVQQHTRSETGRLIG